MKVENAIEVDNITKSFKVYKDRGNMLKEMVLFSNRRKYEVNEVLKGISFTVKKGEAIGLIGHNGCGKSTTLKLLTKIIYPDTGKIEMQGRVSSLLELGAGFHPDMSGRENIYINASIFGLTREEIDNRLDDIIAFSELENYIDNPVRTYSSGMYMRLAFSVAINVDADILLIDEILSVGDANFQAKCFNKLRDIKAEGATIVIVSHALGQIEQICERSIWIHDGVIRDEGKPREVHLAYLDYMGKRRIERYNEEISKNPGKKKQEDVEQVKETNDLIITGVKLINRIGDEANVFTIKDTMILEIEYKRNNTAIKEAGVGFHIFRNDGLDFVGGDTYVDKLPMGKLQDSGNVRIEIDEIWFAPAKYEIDIMLSDEFGVTYHRFNKRITFDVVNNYDIVGVGEVKRKYFFDDVCVGGVGYKKLTKEEVNVTIQSETELLLDRKEGYIPILAVIENRGKTPLEPNYPYPVQLSYYVIDKEGNIIVEGGKRTPLSVSLMPGHSRTEQIMLDAADLFKGAYIELKMVQELNFWFDGGFRVKIVKKV